MRIPETILKIRNKVKTFKVPKKFIINQIFKDLTHSWTNDYTMIPFLPPMLLQHFPDQDLQTRSSNNQKNKTPLNTYWTAFADIYESPCCVAWYPIPNDRCRAPLNLLCYRDGARFTNTLYFVSRQDCLSFFFFESRFRDNFTQKTTLKFVCITDLSCQIFTIPNFFYSWNIMFGHYTVLLFCLSWF